VEGSATEDQHRSHVPLFLLSFSDMGALVLVQAMGGGGRRKAIIKYLIE